MDTIPAQKHPMEPETWHTPTLIHSGECDHHFIWHHTDDLDGMANARCAYCPAGILYNPDLEPLVDGKLRKA